MMFMSNERNAYRFCTECLSGSSSRSKGNDSNKVQRADQCREHQEYPNSVEVA